MFFIGIFGVENKEKEIKDIQNISCKSCGSLSSYKLIKTYNFFHFFFLPLFKWKEQYYVISRCCNRLFSIPRELGQDIEAGKDVVITDSDLTELSSLGGSLCPSCHNHIEDHFVYCPYCGYRMK